MNPRGLPLTVYYAIGFEYWANPSKPEEGFITWQTDGKPSIRMGASAVGPDQGTDGSGVSQRRIPEEPMVRLILLSRNSSDFDILRFSRSFLTWVSRVIGKRSIYRRWFSLQSTWSITFGYTNGKVKQTSDVILLITLPRSILLIT